MKQWNAATAALTFSERLMVELLGTEVTLNLQGKGAALAEVSHQSELPHRVQTAMGVLSPREQEILLAYYGDQLDLEDVATRMELQPSAVRNHLHAVARRLKSHKTLAYLCGNFQPMPEHVTPDTIVGVCILELDLPSHVYRTLFNHHLDTIDLVLNQRNSLMELRGIGYITVRQIMENFYQLGLVEKTALGLTPESAAQADLTRVSVAALELEVCYQGALVRGGVNYISELLDIYRGRHVHYPCLSAIRGIGFKGNKKIVTRLRELQLLGPDEEPIKVALSPDDSVYALCSNAYATHAIARAGIKTIAQLMAVVIDSIDIDGEPLHSGPFYHIPRLGPQGQAKLLAALREHDFLP